MSKRWKIVTLALTFCLAAHPTTALAGEGDWGWDNTQYGWYYDDSGWRYYYETGGYPQNGWLWLDGNHDGVSECYYFGADGYVATDTVIDGSTVNSDGAWVVDGIVQTSYSTGFIKQVYLDLLAKPQEEVERVLGTDYLMSERWIVANHYEYMDYTLGGTKPEQVEVTLLDGKVEHIEAKGVALFNATKDSYTISEISDLISIPAEIGERGGATWYLSDDLTKFLEYWEGTYTLMWY